MEPRLMTIKAKKIGLFLRLARKKRKYSIQDCAHWLGIPEDQYENIETGNHLPSLPQLESLSYYLDCSFNSLTNDQIGDLIEGFTNPSTNLELIKLRDRIISISLKQKRVKNKLTVEDLANAVSLPGETITAYEDGKSSIPFLHLEAILEALTLTPEKFFSQNGPFSIQHIEEPLKASSIGSDLPEDLVEFISKPVNRPYLEIAMRLSQMEADKLRSIATSLLEITY